MNRIVRHLRPLRRLALGLCIAGAASFAAAQGAAPASGLASTSRDRASHSLPPAPRERFCAT